MPKNAVLRLFFINWSLGVLLGIVFASGILLLDLGGLRSLIMRSDMAVAALAMLYGGFAITCGGVVCASAIMRLPAADDGDSGTGRVAERDGPIPVPVMVHSRFGAGTRR